MTHYVSALSDRRLQQGLQPHSMSVVCRQESYKHIELRSMCCIHHQPTADKLCGCRRRPLSFYLTHLLSDQLNSHHHRHPPLLTDLKPKQHNRLNNIKTPTTSEPPKPKSITIIIYHIHRDTKHNTTTSPSQLNHKLTSPQPQAHIQHDNKLKTTVTLRILQRQHIHYFF